MTTFELQDFCQVRIKKIFLKDLNCASKHFYVQFLKSFSPCVFPSAGGRRRADNLEASRDVESTRVPPLTLIYLQHFLLMNTQSLFNVWVLFFVSFCSVSFVSVKERYVTRCLVFVCVSLSGVLVLTVKRGRTDSSKPEL